MPGLRLSEDNVRISDMTGHQVPETHPAQAETSEVVARVAGGGGRDRFWIAHLHVNLGDALHYDEAAHRFIHSCGNAEQSVIAEHDWR